MSLISYLFTLICYQPLLNVFIFVYGFLPYKDIGIAIIILTILIKLILYPFSRSTIKAQKAMNELQPKINELKEKYSNDKEKQALEMMNLYKENKINPLSSCLPLIIQLPFLIAIYQVFNTGLRNGSLDLLYPFVKNILNNSSINTIAFGFIDMSQPLWVFAILAGLAQFWQAKMMLNKRPEVKNKDSADEDMTAIMSKQMMFMMPIMTVFIGWTLPSGLVFYWFLLTILTALQQLFMIKKQSNKV